MTDSNAGLQVVPVADLREYFRDALQGALGHQHLKVDDHTEHYVVNLLTLFSRAEALHEGARPAGARTGRWRRCWPMRSEAPTAEARCRALQRLGDVSLFFAGFFAGSFARKLVDIDYHIAMGGRAYGTLAGASAAARGACSGRCSANSPRSSSRWSMR